MLLGILDHRQVPQAQEVHFEKPQLLDGGHGVLGDDGIVIPGQGHIAANRLGGYHHTGRVGGGIPGHPLQPHGGIHQFFHSGVPIVEFLETGGILQSGLEGHMGPGGHQLGHHIGFREGEVQRPAHIPDGAPGSHGAEGDDLCHPVGTILAVNIVDDLPPALLTEIRIEIGHTHPLRVQEPFEDQAVFHGIHFRNVDAVGNNGACSGTTARTHGNARLFCIVDKIPDDQVVVYITHRADDADFILHPLPVFLRFLRITLPEALITELAEVFLVGIALRHRVGGQVILMKGKLHIAHIGNFLGIGKGLVAAGEQSAKLLLAFQVELLGFEPHPVLIVNGLAGLDAQQHILHIRVLFAQIMGIVGDDQGKPLLPGKALQALIHRALGFDAMVLKLQIEPVRTEHFTQPQSVFPGALVILVEKGLRDGAAQAGGQGDKPLMALLQQLQIDAGLSVEAMQKGFRNHVAQVLIALLVFAEQDKVVAFLIQAVNLVCHSPGGHIDLAADDGLDPRCLGSFVKINAAVHDTVIGQGHGGLPQLLYPVHKAVDAAGAVQQAILAMDVKMYKTHCSASFASSTIRFSRWFMAGLVMGGSIMAASSAREDSGFSSLALAAWSSFPGRVSKRWV